ncbi:hypothetical protein [Streptomyces sp. R08]|uniref:Secreted protein n=1 Tax=Streptomyces sp. R08 TaxID=3238624 RepID=A0AB39M2N7_9ACTN
MRKRIAVSLAAAAMAASALTNHAMASPSASADLANGGWPAGNFKIKNEKMGQCLADPGGYRHDGVTANYCSRSNVLTVAWDAAADSLRTTDGRCVGESIGHMYVYPYNRGCNYRQSAVDGEIGEDATHSYSRVLAEPGAGHTYGIYVEGGGSASGETPKHYFRLTDGDASGADGRFVASGSGTPQSSFTLVPVP